MIYTIRGTLSHCYSEVENFGREGEIQLLQVVFLSKANNLISVISITNSGQKKNEDKYIKLISQRKLFKTLCSVFLHLVLWWVM